MTANRDLSSKSLSIVHRLRQNATNVDCLNDPYPEILLEAADAIERLQREIASLHQERIDTLHDWRNCIAERDRLQRHLWRVGAGESFNEIERLQRELLNAAEALHECAAECADCNYGSGATGKASEGGACESCAPIREAERRATVASGRVEEPKS